MPSYYYNVWLQIERADLEAEEYVTLEPFTERLASFRTVEAANKFVEELCASITEPEGDVSDDYIQEVHDRSHEGGDGNERS